jgi:hypothetical protein
VDAAAAAGAVVTDVLTDVVVTAAAVLCATQNRTAACQNPQQMANPHNTVSSVRTQWRRL